MSRVTAWVTAGAALLMAAALLLLARQVHSHQQRLELPTPYQAVALANGQVFFGRLDADQGDFLVLRDSFYIQSRQNPESREVANVLVKRGGEAHGPDRMLINRHHILLLEPVAEDSRIGKLIAEQQVSR
ncbi:hypothetical protein [Zoogloea sp.]|uniref:hypothetical protein n=1 Tax=Zoogloea sp. TaxID=49181 RepID=UPI002634D05D|nr:hypothetical protein [Zoogloea sp.]MDD3352823.1 hypothetical protein [Zoogloea sp.]